MPTLFCFAFAAGLATAVAARVELRVSPRTPLSTRSFRAFLLYALLLLIPISVYFYIFHGDWFLLYTLDVTRVPSAIALIGFGFTIFQVMQHLNQMTGVKAPQVPEAPRYLCLAMIGAGVIACVIAISEYRFAVRYLFAGEFRAVAGMDTGKPRASVVQPLAVLLLFVGVFAFLAVLLRAS